MKDNTNNRINIVSALFLQIVTMLSGLILPRLILQYFGSEINGMVSSITQLLSFISLLEGGLGAVVLTELYKPIEDRDDVKVNSILNACQSFFTKLSIVYIIYTVIMGLVYVLFVENSYSPAFTCTLVYILSFSTLIQYVFSITSKLLLQAQQRIYIVNLVSAGTVIANLAISVVLIHIYPDIHMIKLGSAVTFLVQPIIYNRVIQAKFKGKLRAQAPRGYKLENRWNGFAQNLAHFVSLNSAVTIITVFLTLEDVSVFSVYMLAISAIRLLISSATNSYQSALGMYYARNDREQLRNSFDSYDKMNAMMSVVLFGTCLLLINPFIQLYTAGINDANYYQPLFAMVIVIANLLYCMREPYRLLVLAAGKFKETNKGAIIESVLNLVVSSCLVFKFGLLGVAIGNLVATAYRFVYFIVFLQKSVLFKKIKDYAEVAIKFAIMLAVNIALYFVLEITLEGYLDFFIHGVLILIVELVLSYILFYKVRLNGTFRNKNKQA